MSSSPSSSEISLHHSQNPSNWRFTWEAQSHIPTLRLYLFNPFIKPSYQCTDLKSELVIGKSSLLVGFIHSGAETSLKVPLPRALIDPESPVHFRAHDDHIEFRLALLLPIDHPLVSEFDSAASDEFRPLSADSDVKQLSALEEVYFYCRNCSTKLTRSLSCFKELPSVNWQEAADNWFGTCCCSFGGISEKLATRYAKSYACSAGSCLLDVGFVILCKDDLLGCEFPDRNGNCNNEFSIKLASDSILAQTSADNVSKQGQIVLQNIDGKDCCLDCKEEKAKLEHEDVENGVDSGSLSLTYSPLGPLHVAENVAALPDIHTDLKSNMGNCDNGCCSLDLLDVSLVDKNSIKDNELLVHQKLLLNGFLSNGFLARSSNLSKDVSWVEFLCPQCSSVLGAYPSLSDHAPLDGGVRLFKCHISTSLPVSGSNDLFRHYSLERMFATQLLESAKDELSFRTVVRDMHTNEPLLQMVLLNPDSWCCSGCCLHTMEPASGISMCPALKVLFSACSYHKEIDSRRLKEWITKNQVDELYMLRSQIEELIASLKSANSTYPPSQVVLQDLSLSSMKR